MGSLHIALSRDYISTKSSIISWYSNEQMAHYSEIKDSRWHGAWKHWSLKGELYWYRIYENGRLVKEIL